VRIRTKHCREGGTGNHGGMTDGQKTRKDVVRQCCATTHHLAMLKLSCNFAALFLSILCYEFFTEMKVHLKTKHELKNLHLGLLCHLCFAQVWLAPPDSCSSSLASAGSVRFLIRAWRVKSVAMGSSCSLKWFTVCSHGRILLWFLHAHFLVPVFRSTYRV
jgi:hypothetical protein